MLLIIIIFGAGFIIGSLLIVAIVCVRSSTPGRHEFSRHSMPDLDLDEDMMRSVRRDNSVNTFRSGDDCDGW